MIGADLRTWLLETVGLESIVDARCHQNVVPEESVAPYCWFGRAGLIREDALDDAVGTDPFRQTFDLEFYGTVDEVDGEDGMAAKVNAQHLYRGVCGSGRVQAVFVTDHADDYVPRGHNGDEGVHLASLQIEVVGYSP